MLRRQKNILGWRDWEEEETEQSSCPAHPHLFRCSSQKNKAFCYFRSLTTPSLTLCNLLCLSCTALTRTDPLCDVPHAVLTALFMASQSPGDFCLFSPLYHSTLPVPFPLLTNFLVLLRLQVTPMANILTSDPPPLLYPSLPTIKGLANFSRELWNQLWRPHLPSKFHRGFQR